MSCQITELVDIPVIQSLLESQSAATGTMFALLDPEEKILASSGWQPICSEFHRRHPETGQRCRMSNATVKGILEGTYGDQDFVEYCCRNGLMSLATPVLLEGKHLATLVSGQFLCEKPQLSFFREQARRYGFDEAVYLEALAQIPVYSREQVRNVLQVLRQFVNLLTRMGTEKLELIQTQQELRRSEEKYRSLFDGNSDAILILDRGGHILEVNRAASRLHGYTEAELRRMHIDDLLPPEEVGQVNRRLAQALGGAQTIFESGLLCQDGTCAPAEVRISPFDHLGVQALRMTVRDLRVQKRIAEGLRESEMRFQSFFNASSAGMVIFRPDGTPTAANRAFCDFFGYSEAELSGISIEALTHPEDRELTRCFYREVAAGERPLINYEKRYLRKDGNTVWGHASAAPVYDGSGALSYYVALVQDVTYRKLAETELSEAHRRLLDIIDFLPDATFVIDGEGRVVAWNRAIEELTGQPKTQILGRGNRAYAVPFYGEPRPLLIDLVQEQNREVEARYDFIERSGERLFTEVHVPLAYGGRGAYLWATASPLFDQSGRRVGAIETIRDISDRKRSEERTRRALGEAEAARDNIDAILRSVADGLIVTDTKGRIVLMNRTAEELAGGPLVKVLGQPVEEVIGGAELSARIAAVLSGERKDATLMLEAGSVAEKSRTFQAKTACVQCGAGKPSGTITLLRDVTRERELDRMKSEFISTAAHELRTPLTTVKGFSELLLENANLAAETRQEYLSFVHEKAQVLERIISDMLNLSRVEAGRMVQLELDSFNLSEELERLVAQYRRAWGEHRFSLALPQGAVSLVGDRGKINQVLENLMSNAVKFSPAGGEITLVLNRSGDAVRVSVCDEGIGMGPEDVERIFDKFYRADASNTAVAGLGLGMAIVKGIVEAHGGRIGVESAPGAGTIITFTLPLEMRV